jgi:hypothetical protein
MKHIYPKLFYQHELKEGGEINILQIKSCDNLADLFTKSLPLATFDKYVKDIDMQTQRFVRFRRRLSLNKNPIIFS